MARTEGVVTAIRFGATDADNIYTIVSESVMQLKSGIRLELYDRVAVRTDAGSVEVDLLGRGEAECQGLIDGIVNSMGIAEPSTAYLKDSGADAMKRLAPEMKEAARTFLRALVSGAPMIVRFHNDGDGGDGALALYMAVEELKARLRLESDSIVWIMNPGVSYKTDLFYSDALLMNGYISAVRPVITIIDFGTSPDSSESVRMARGKYDFVWLDHHPINGFDYSPIGHYASPWLEGGDSNLTAGVLACCFAEMMSGINASLFKKASLISDHSSYADYSDKRAADVAMVVDALTVKPEAPSGQRITPKYMAGVLGDRAKFEEILHDVVSQFSEALEIGLKKSKRHTSQSGIAVYTFDYSAIADEGFRYVTKGKFSTRLQDMLEEKSGERTVTLVYDKGTISVRMSKNVAPEVGIIRIINEMIEEADYVDSGGGHNEAASIRTDSSHMKELLSLMLDKLGVTRS